MTYTEAYLNCKSYDEFKSMLYKDTIIAGFLNSDRLKSIENACNEVFKIHPEWEKIDE